MAPKPSPASKGRARDAVPKGAAAPAAPVPRSPSSPIPQRPGTALGSAVEGAQAGLAQVPAADWSALADVLAEPPVSAASVLEALLLLLGDPDPSSWARAREACQDPPSLLRELQALGTWGAPEAALVRVAAILEALDLDTLGQQPAAAAKQPAAPKPAAAGRVKAAAPSRPGAKAPAARAKAAAAAAPRAPWAPAVMAVGRFLDAVVAARKAERAPRFPMVWPEVPFAQLHVRLQQAYWSRQAVCVICPTAPALRATRVYCRRRGAVLCDVQDLQVRVHLSKKLTAEAARAELGLALHGAMAEGRLCVFSIGDTPPNLRRYCDSAQVPLDVFDGERLGEAARAVGLGDGAAAGFQVMLLAQLSKARAEQLLPQVLPCFDEMAVLVLGTQSLPAPDILDSLPKSAPGLRAALQALAIPPASASPDAAAGVMPASAVAGVTPASPGGGASPGTAPASPAAAAAAPATPGAAAAPVGPSRPATALGASQQPLINVQEFEFVESFGEDWEQRWSRGPAKKDERGNPIKEGLIHATLVKYPSNPQVAKPCLQLVGGAMNAPCTGIWTTFSPLARPTEVEFEFTMMGKVDMPNACVVFTERAFEGALPECKIGLQFIVRSGMQLSGGGGNLVRINNDGKLQSDKWSKVRLKIDWAEKSVFGQVDTRGKGYAPAMQSVPFRDSTCEGFGFLYIYNTDVQATCWIHSLRVQQEASASVAIDKAALDDRAHLAARLKEREYQRAVDADMEVGMKMGAIKATREHGMNLAQEQASNEASAAAARMG